MTSPFFLCSSLRKINKTVEEKSQFFHHAMSCRLHDAWCSPWGINLHRVHDRCRHHRLCCHFLLLRNRRRSPSGCCFSGMASRRARNTIKGIKRYSCAPGIRHATTKTSASRASHGVGHIDSAPQRKHPRAACRGRHATGAGASCRPTPR